MSPRRDTLRGMNPITIPTSDVVALAETLSVRLGVPAEIRRAITAELTTRCGRRVLLVETGAAA
ncbi:Uncharacterised protein [Mycobacteroides abscessus subsp. abscessus]|nr:hypothetical protein B9M80_12810 [Mycobacteroides abscessus]SKQ67977.1 Uncharacterised protein [Mycobacteroides abscessus subsp. abscessus]